MSTAKFEKLIDLIINEDQERAEQLFHEIVVEKSREIYENLMDEDTPVDDLMDEIESEGAMDVAMEADDEMDMDSEDDMDMGDDEMDMDMGDDEMDMDSEDDMEMDADDEMDMDSEDEPVEDEPATKDDIMNLEDKLDELMAEFEALMNKDEGEEEEEEEEEEEGEEEEEESGVMESVELKKVAPVKHGDDGAQTKSPVTANSGGKGVGGDRKPVNFSGGAAESGGKAAAPREMGMKFKNSPGASVTEKGESAPKPKTENVKAHSVLPEGKTPAKQPVKAPAKTPAKQPAKKSK